MDALSQQLVQYCLDEDHQPGSMAAANKAEFAANQIPRRCHQAWRDGRRRARGPQRSDTERPVLPHPPRASYAGLSSKDGQSHGKKVRFPRRGIAAASMALGPTPPLPLEAAD